MARAVLLSPVGQGCSLPTPPWGWPHRRWVVVKVLSLHETFSDTHAIETVFPKPRPLQPLRDGFCQIQASPVLLLACYLSLNPLTFFYLPQEQTTYIKYLENKTMHYIVLANIACLNSSKSFVKKFSKY